MAEGINSQSVTIKRAVAIALLLLLLGLLLGVIVSALTSFPVAAANELEAFLRSQPVAAMRTEALVRARRPWNLDRGLGLDTAGDSLYFETDLWYGSGPGDTPPMEEGVPTSAIRSEPRRDRTPLPYPPVEAWCILIQSAAGPQVLVVARHHREPYQTDWIIHQQTAAPSPAAWAELLDLVGCERLLSEAR